MQKMAWILPARMATNLPLAGELLWQKPWFSPQKFRAETMSPEVNGCPILRHIHKLISSHCLQGFDHPFAAEFLRIFEKIIQNHPGIEKAKWDGWLGCFIFDGCRKERSGAAPEIWDSLWQTHPNMCKTSAPLCSNNEKIVGKLMFINPIVWYFISFDSSLGFIASISANDTGKIFNHASEHSLGYWH